MSCCLKYLLLLCAISLLTPNHSYSKPTENDTVQYWVDPMEPQVRYDKPGKSSMSMELVPVYANKDIEMGDQTIHISPNQISNFGIRSAKAEYKMLSPKLKAFGYVALNESEIDHVHIYEEGWVRKLYVKNEEEPVKKDQLLLELYSPKLNVVQGEYLRSIQDKDKQFIALTRDKLIAKGVTLEQIENIEKTNKPDLLIKILAPADGIIQSLGMREGMYVTPDTTIMSIVNTSSVWVIADIPLTQANVVKVNQEVDICTYDTPQNCFKSKVDFIYPILDKETKTVKVRFYVPNPEAKLKINEYVNVELLGEAKGFLSIPKEAVIYGSAKNRVIIAKGDGMFEPRFIKSGIELDDRIEILEGLNESEQVVTSGQFLIDSEANLKGALDSMNTEEPEIISHGKQNL